MAVSISSEEAVPVLCNLDRELKIDTTARVLLKLIGKSIDYHALYVNADPAHAFRRGDYLRSDYDEKEINGLRAATWATANAVFYEYIQLSRETGLVDVAKIYRIR